MIDKETSMVSYKLRGFSKIEIIFKLAILIAIEVLLVVSSFGVSTYIESQSTAIGNTINLAGKNRYLTSNLLLQFEKVNDGSAQIELVSGMRQMHWMKIFHS